MAQQRQKTRGRQVRAMPAKGLRRAAGEYVVATLASLGLAVSAYLLYLYYTDASGAFCAAGSGCDIVRGSPYSKVLGTPVSLLGVIGYAAILALSLWPMPWDRKRLPLYFLALAGFTYSAYLTYLELFIIKAICLYCVVSAILMTGILVTFLLQRPPVPILSSRRLQGLSLFMVALVLAVPSSPLPV